MFLCASYPAFTDDPLLKAGVSRGIGAVLIPVGLQTIPRRLRVRGITHPVHESGSRRKAR
jgi:hypothetical protein